MNAASSDEDEEEDGLRTRLGRKYVRLPCGLICVAEHLAASAARDAPDKSGGMVRQASEELATWICRHASMLSSFDSAIELGAGVGLVSIVLAKLGVSRVIATDGNARLARLIQKNAARNGIEASQLQAVTFRWEHEPDALLASVGRAGLCSPLVLASDVLYSSDDSHFDPLEGALRALVARGGCRLVVFSWHVRNCNEEGFLPRLKDLGKVSTVWRSHGLPCDDALPSSGEAAIHQWRLTHTGTWAIATLEVFGGPALRPPASTRARQPSPCVDRGCSSAYTMRCVKTVPRATSEGSTL
mmetsp:Transcript_9377/g.21756  ORF Transcript_9377/g.21756 Transcript_9377/m.21756 type:complete len:300 (-) Transcript_9377:95-994(-)|eukprot:CAMPEP_0119359880 /NCGR_PEP_ID=MMETSP1334-20130426/7658_1 /TAXON_ID=127549 /ORGANISM="Calcidiscus leptoporus, Strain RCC1130" /LENGTH=299 /DNA_ID=CAMNT_0007374629 /DNA_START=207 /DNA_END=1106 /DNA_ORIENTATION=-